MYIVFWQSRKDSVICQTLALVTFAILLVMAFFAKYLNPEDPETLRVGLLMIACLPLGAFAYLYLWCARSDDELAVYPLWLPAATEDWSKSFWELTLSLTDIDNSTRSLTQDEVDKLNATIPPSERRVLLHCYLCPRGWTARDKFRIAGPVENILRYGFDNAIPV